jgi:hypothetical protein
MTGYWSNKIEDFSYYLNSYYEDSIEKFLEVKPISLPTYPCERPTPSSHTEIFYELPRCSKIPKRNTKYEGQCEIAVLAINVNRKK